MPIPPINPAGSSEWQIGGIGTPSDVTQLDQTATQPATGNGGGFGGMLTNAISSLEQTQVDAAGASQSLVNGTATDPTQVVMAVERARLSMQLASQIRNKAVEAYTDIFHTQV
jgi:flagellar hook-basal body complex protein FliE